VAVRTAGASTQNSPLSATSRRQAMPEGGPFRPLPATADRR
jgi:hypothetical protein